jgi:hypothetical protein
LSHSAQLVRTFRRQIQDFYPVEMKLYVCPSKKTHLTINQSKARFAYENLAY